MDVIHQCVCVCVRDAPDKCCSHIRHTVTWLQAQCTVCTTAPPESGPQKESGRSARTPRSADYAGATCCADVRECAADAKEAGDGE
ncbi:hypothetical protein JOB18_034473 [Solea senegalensis]|uniref:Uncharacterized protein n=1 Tax=Solea senegalensis TaxID=28829 RepID=A0AAV6SW42_SOLSE|nr:hypothetical protein JOB18_034473 [Solea senegalensis]